MLGLAFVFFCICRKTCDSSPTTRIQRLSRRLTPPGSAAEKAVIDSVRKAEKNVITVDAGDMVQGSLYFKYFRGDVEYPLMNMMGYDVRILGNHEFDNGMADLAEKYKTVKADRLSANYNFDGTELEGVFKPYVIKKVGGKK